MPSSAGVGIKTRAPVTQNASRTKEGIKRKVNPRQNAFINWDSHQRKTQRKCFQNLDGGAPWSKYRIEETFQIKNADGSFLLCAKG
ncbi:hypothetical protein D7Z54_17355 [Salibacterium salarium]|uniref:Uncharacterized protein n=1 Tax=Salibacterium salarium TaxID=284579 RepID=A0A3R9P7S0_9BACI|nr:hypothetical protein D7Z54_17355 [Salibacterium salarium]